MRAPAQLAEVMEGRAVKERARGVGIVDRRGRVLVEGRQGGRRGRVGGEEHAGARDRLEAREPRDLPPRARRAASLMHVAAAGDFGAQPHRPVREGQPAQHLHVAQRDDRAPRAPRHRAREAIDHRHHRQGRHREGRAVIAEPRVHCRIEHLVVVVGRGRARAAGDDPHAEVSRRVDPLAVDPQPGVGDRVAPALVVADLGEFQLRGDRAIRRDDLPAVLPGHGAPEHQRLEARRRPARRPCRARACRTGAAGTAPRRRASRLHRVLEEVRLEEPLARIDVFLGAQVAEPLAAAVGPTAGDAIEHQQHRAGQARGALEEARGPRREVDRGLRRRGDACALLVGGGEPGLVLERRLREEPEDGVHLVDAPLAEEALDLERSR